MATTNKRPLISNATPPPSAVRSSGSALQNTTNKQTPTTPTNSLPSLPNFLALPRPNQLSKFRAINQHEAALRSDPKAILSHPLALARNRYPDIHPWAHNRVHLSSLDFPYINASPIALGRANEKFIATQGPVEQYRTSPLRRVIQGQGGNGAEWGDGEGSSGGNESGNGGFGHFWEMVWQEDVEVIVMLTRCIEEGREKCGVYYPNATGETIHLECDSTAAGKWGSVKCECLRVECGTEIRELKLSKRVEKVQEDELSPDEEAEELVTKTIWHFLFLAWPDQDVPQTAADQRALLELIKMTRFRINAVIDKKTSPQAGLKQQNTPPSFSHPYAKEVHKPRIVHCSAGVGRTGTFIALDFLLQEMEEGKFDALKWEEDPIFECVKKLREQRMFMVYKATQYMYIYQVLKEKWTKRLEMVVGGKENSEAAQGEQSSPTKKRKIEERDEDVFQ